MKIYGSKTGGNPRRVALFLAEKDIDIPFEDVDLFGGAHKTPEFLEKSPTAEIPVLELDDGTCISETLAICRYFEVLQPEPSLFGIDALEQAQIEMWQRRVEFRFYAPVRYFVRHTIPFAAALEPIQIKEWGELNRSRVDEGFTLLDHQLAEHPFIAGERYSVADITAQFTMDFTAMAGIEVPDNCLSIRRWFAEVSGRPSALATMAPPQS